LAGDAARADTKTARYWGERADDGGDYEKMADLSLKKLLPDAVLTNCANGYAATAPVGSFKPNPWGSMTSSATSWNRLRTVMSQITTKRQPTAVRL
jgi:formylglycine-generating enzyme